MSPRSRKIVTADSGQRVSNASTRVHIETMMRDKPKILGQGL